MESEELTETDVYYTRLLQSFKKDEDREIREREQETRPLNIISALRPEPPTDPHSPYAFMTSMKFRMWNQQKSALEDIREQKKLLKLTRENNRMLFLSERDAEKGSSLPKNGNIQIVLKRFQSSTHSAMDRHIEKDILNQYRKDPDNLERLLLRINAKKENPKSALDRKKEKHGQKSLEDRLFAAKIRRETVETPSIKTVTRQSEENPPNIEQKQISTAINYMDRRKRQWLVIVATITRIICFEELLRLARIDTFTSWKAAKIIQRSWRRHQTYYQRQQSKESALKIKFKTSEDCSKMNENREVAALLIISFLQDTTIRRMTKNFLKSIRKIQMDIRGLRAITDCRMTLLQRFVEVCIQPLAQHIQVVLAGRGLDLNNISFFELTNLKNLQNARSLTIIRAMHSKQFHAKLRANASKLVDYQREYSGSGRIWLDARNVELRQEMLKHFLSMKREQFFEEAVRRRGFDISVPEITMDEVQLFIKSLDTDEDPLRRHLERVQEIIEKQRERKQKKFPFRKKPIKEAVKIPRMLLLTSIDPEEVLTLLLQFINIVRIHHTVASQHSQEDSCSEITNKNYQKGKVLSNVARTIIDADRPSLKLKNTTSHDLGLQISNGSNEYENHPQFSIARPPTSPQRSMFSPNKTRLSRSLRK